VFSVATLHLHATADAVEHEWRRALAAGGIVELGLGRATPRELVEAAATAVESGERLRLGPIGERLVVDAVAEGAGGALTAIAQSRGLRKSLGRIFAALGRVGVGPGELARAALDAGGMAGAYANEIARRLAAYDRHLANGRLFDEAALWRAGCRAIAGGASLAMLADVEVVETHELVDWDGAQLQLLDALLARGLVVRVAVPAVAELPPSAGRALEPLLGALEARHGAHRLERVEVPLGRARAIDYTLAPTPSSEARHVAQRVRDLVDAGVAPESIAVCAATPERRARLQVALERYGVPVAPRRPASAADAPPVRIALELLALADDDIPRERFIQLITSRYVAGEAHGKNGLVLPHEIAAALRAAYVTDASGRGYAEGLATWARGQFRHVLRAGQAETICRHIDHLVELIKSLPAEATVERHAARLRAVLEKLELFLRARGFRKGRATASVDETRAIARDQAAMRELDVALVDLPRAAARAGLRSSKLSRGRFARLLGELLAAARPRAGGVRGAAVELSELGGVAGRRFAHLFACGLVDGELPTRPPEDPLLADDDRVALNRAFGDYVLPLAARAGDQSTLAFFLALGAAEAAHLSWTRGDEDGAPCLRSPLIDELAPAKSQIVELVRDPIPRARDARSVDELTARVVLEVRGDRASRLSAHDGEAAALLPAIAAHDPPRLGRLEHLIAVERQRHRFFVGDIAAHGYVGVLRDPALVAALAAQKLPGRREEPLSATSVEQYASCPFKFFLRAVLRVGEQEEVDDEIDHRTLGRLYHDVLEQLFSRLTVEQRFPLVVDEALTDLAEEVCDDVVAKWRRTEPLGHPALFAVEERRLRERVLALLHAEEAREPAEGCTPTHFERAFGPLAFGDVWVRGKIDRIDVGPGRAVVLDYKTGGKKPLTEQIKEDALCVTSWQLPIYAAAARSELGLASVEARFYSLREAAPTRAVQEPPDFVEKLGALHANMRAGDFAVRPVEEACERCGMEAACRVRQLRRAEDLP
jgi:ATP-dependent helicase/nuclease subunit B